MYLMIFEDGEIKSAEEVGIDDTQAADDGLLDLIDISDPFNPTRYWGGEWKSVEDVND
ncbi:hypothetical protein [Pseudomonas typographi]|uniref:Uncharacterized protein n=1 Tax=Pseudomonas typographi TaxID=2715964 RepID=A0ABR7ZAN7_9PSED|nr:hypothetical protein [Pseudomonas typographi]MBD1602519.1 hypothetical protein [Pseudomonas typographi]